MSSKANKNKLPPFVPLLLSTIDSPAWLAMSHGARSLYVALKRRVPRYRNVAYLSCRDAAASIGCSKTSVGLWYRELQHYGFIVLARHGCLGVDGKGKAPHWRLTERGVTSQASAGGIPEPPTRDFLSWDGTPFDKGSKNKTPSTRAGQGVHPWGTMVSTREGHSNAQVSTRGGHREHSKCPPLGDITTYHSMEADLASADATDVASADESDGYPDLPEFLKRL